MKVGMLGSGDPDRRPITVALLTLALIAASMKAWSGVAAESVEEPAYLPAGVSDEAGAVGCLPTPEGGVEAVDLATGRSLWRAAAPARALAVARGQAFVLEERAGHRLRVAAYTARSGRLIRKHDLTTLDLPPWASLAEPGDGRDRTVFEVTARLQGETLEVRYDATRMRASGFRAPWAVGQYQGAARVGLHSGRVELRPGPGPTPPALSEPAPPVRGVRLVAVHARAPDAKLVLGGPPASVDGALVVGVRRLAFELSPDTMTVVVHRWSASGGGREPPLRLEHGQATDAVWVTIDRHHVLLRRAYEQSWYDLYSLQTGQPKGRLERPVDVAVVGPRIYWTTHQAAGGLALVATDAVSGRTLWRRTVRHPDRRPAEPIP